MGDYFKPWQRKIGLLMLVMACVFMAVWMRSRSIIDLIALPASFDPNPKSMYVIVSGKHGLAFEAMSGDREIMDKRGWWWVSDWHANSIGWPGPAWTLESKSDYFVVLIEKRRNGFIHGHFTVVPYGSIVIPLTLVSAWLLLSKPRAPKTIDPVSDRA